MTGLVCTCGGTGLRFLVSLFDGIAGFPLAFSRAGVRTTATVEIDKAAAGVAADHFPEAKCFADVREVTADDILSTGFCPAHGVLSAGWPCTDLSLAGLRLGLGGARSGLVGEVFRLLLDLRPRWFVLENVPGLLSSVCPCPGGGICSAPGCTAGPHPVRGGACGRKRAGGRRQRGYTGPGRCMALHGGGMGTVLRRLGECGYGLAYRVLDAQNFGVPQRRRRVVIVGRLGDWAGPAEVLLEPEGGGGHPAPGRSAGARTARSAAVRTRGSGSAVNSLTTGSLSKYDDNSAQGGHLVAPTLQGGGRRGYRVDAETAAGGGLITAGHLTAKSGGADENDAAVNHLVAYQGRGANVGEMGALRTGSSAAGGGPFVATTLTAREGKGPDSDATTTLVTHALTAEGFDASEDGTGRGTPLVPVDLAQVTSSENRSNPQAGDPAGTLAAGGRPAVAFGHTNGIDVQASESVVPTMRAGHHVGGGAVADSAGVRRLTPTECERLQGYPDGWTAMSHGRPQADSPRYRQLGNSIAVPVFAWVAGRMVTVEERS